MVNNDVAPLLAGLLLNATALRRRGSSQLALAALQDVAACLRRHSRPMRPGALSWYFFGGGGNRRLLLQNVWLVLMVVYTAHALRRAVFFRAVFCFFEELVFWKMDDGSFGRQQGSVDGCACGSCAPVHCLCVYRALFSEVRVYIYISL